MLIEDRGATSTSNAISNTNTNTNATYYCFCFIIIIHYAQLCNLTVEFDLLDAIQANNLLDEFLSGKPPEKITALLASSLFKLK